MILNFLKRAVSFGGDDTTNQKNSRVQETTEAADVARDALKDSIYGNGKISMSIHL